MKVDYEVPLVKFRQVRFEEQKCYYDDHGQKYYNKYIYYKVQQCFRVTYINGGKTFRECIEEWRFLPEILSCDL